MSKKSFVLAGGGGFTLIELLISVSIILLLSSMAVISYQASNKKARDNRRNSDLEQIRAALEMYRSDEDLYPEALSTLVTDYMNEVPSDPKAGAGYVYYYSRTTTTTYDLCAYFESGGTDDCGDNCGAPANCNYKLTNP